MSTSKSLRDYPVMTSWFNPVLLAKLLLRVIVGAMFGQYADRRLIIAALDPVSPQEQLDRADISAQVRQENGAIWLDYVSDLGDGFDATYAIAYFLGQPQLQVGHEDLPRGSLLIMGGDEVYPTSSLKDYKERLREPYELAWPTHAGEVHPPVYMVPGNHDWYDGLTAFLALFCRAKPSRLGHWRTRQRRSYFVIKLAEDWWVWAIDIALTEDMDQPQADYFVAMAKLMPDNAKVILCTAEPGWYEGDRKAASYKCLDYAAWLIDNAKKNLRIVACLSGDTHHYARYESKFGTQFITSGGGGAFLHGTQSLRSTIALDWLKSKNASLTLAVCHPPVTESHRLLRGNIGFALTNPGFSLVLGAIYGLLGFWLSVRFQLDTALITLLVLAAGFCAYAVHQEQEHARKAAGAAFLHAACHWGAVVLLAFVVNRFQDLPLGGSAVGWGQLFLLLIIGLTAGTLFAGTLFGLNLWVTCRWFGMNHNDAFSAMRLDSYRHFLRIKLQGDVMTVYPLGLDRVPTRDQWRQSPGAPAPGVPMFLPPDGTRMSLIEAPIVIHAAAVPPITAEVKPAELKTATPGETPSAPLASPDAGTASPR